MELLTSILEGVLAVSSVFYLVLIIDSMGPFGTKEIKNERRLHIIFFIVSLVNLYISCFLVVTEFLLGGKIFLRIFRSILWIMCSVINYFNIPSK